MQNCNDTNNTSKQILKNNFLIVYKQLERHFNYQKSCFKSAFAGNSILETLGPVFYAISND